MLVTLFPAFLLFMLLGMPVGFAMAISALIAMFLAGSVPLQLIPQNMAGGLDNFTLMAVPFFLLAGEFMEAGGLTPRMVRFAGCLVGHLKGGMMQVSILASLIFAGVSGSAVADASAIGSITVKPMIRKGYDPAYVAAVQAGAAAIGPIFPPSITMIVYASMTSLSVAAMFLGGVIPGVLIALGLMIFNYFYSVRKGYEGEARAGLRELSQTFLAALPALIMPLIILGGIVGGVFTATEAGCVAVIYAAACGAFVYRELRIKDLERVFVRAATTCSMVALIIGASTTFGWVLAIEQFPNLVMDFLLRLTGSPPLVLALLMVFLLVVGCFIDVLPAAIILIPVLHPVAAKFGFDPIHYSVLMVVTLTVGLVTPPVGVVLYITSGLAGVKLSESSRKAIIPAVVMVIVCVLCAYIPPLITAIPRWLLSQTYF
jgi:C4-dicarboxylate transporter DctM subunit